jgi:hypothetical protein
VAPPPLWLAVPRVPVLQERGPDPVTAFREGDPGPNGVQESANEAPVIISPRTIVLPVPALACCVQSCDGSIHSGCPIQKTILQCFLRTLLGVRSAITRTARFIVP